MKAKYIGKDRNRRINGKPLKHGDVIEEPKALVESLLTLADFEPVGSKSKKVEKE